MAESKTNVSLKNVQESKSTTEKRKRFGSAVDKSALALALRTSTSIEVSDSREIDDVAVQTEDRRKRRLCLGLILGIILLCLLIAGIIMACFLPRSYLLDQEIEELKSQMKSQKKTLAALDMTIDAHVKKLTHKAYISCYPKGEPLKYVGDLSTTVSGETCQKWVSQKPHEHYFGVKKEDFGDGIMPENACRETKTGGEGFPWCYTENPNKRWEKCDVPICNA